ncbi:C2 domain-containing protein [Caenorhabditis elegans]|uniref:C2 domain-containing protein n=1 Tax=Caenorhabditis elegans TaxID=6239 RepID=Q9BHL0_CAEEL|nr:C2 domain-containing protein [Caenorhabditis elegans]CAC35853.2 C2 domain-containing protein [Caenorhabditis elegans]|eukprot:NP_499651.2 Uncharacterized protein CELE_Y111B2A.24 [Caenorhabditis elegans]
MKPRRAPVIVKAFDENFQRPTEERDPYDDVQVEKVLKDLSFIRIKLDQIVLPDINPFIQKLHNYREFFGFQLEYTFPCLDAVSKSLKTTIRIPEKEVDIMKIVFNHRRIVLLNMHNDQIEHWQKSQLTIHLLVNMIVNGRQTTRPLAKCHVKLAELVRPPYLISRDFDFVGDDFEGTAELRIDLGSRVQSLTEKLTNLRNERSFDDNTFIVSDRQVGRRTRSRSSSRCRAHSSQSLGSATKDSARASASSSAAPSEIHKRSQSVTSIPAASTSTTTPTPILRPSTLQIPAQSYVAPPRPRIGSSASSMGSDSVFVRDPPTAQGAPPRVFEFPDSTESQFRERTHRTVTESYGASTVADTVEEVSRHGGKYYLEVTVHQATGLPPIEDESGCLASPSTLVSILGRDGDLRSPVFRNSRNPNWNFMARFALSSERRNLVVKVIHRGALLDLPLGFVSIPLPTPNFSRSVYEMTDITKMAAKYTHQVPMLTISVEKVRNIDDDDDDEENNHHYEQFRKRAHSSRSTQSSPPPPSAQYLLRIESPPILESSEVIKERMQRCMADLENMMRGINK